MIFTMRTVQDSADSQRHKDSILYVHLVSDVASSNKNTIGRTSSSIVSDLPWVTLTQNIPRVQKKDPLLNGP